MATDPFIADLARQQHRQLLPGASLTSLAVTLALGLGITASAFQYAVHEDELRLDSHVENSVQAMAAASAVATYTQPLFDALTSAFTRIQQDVAKGVVMTDQQFRQYLWDKPVAGLETTSLALLPLVPAGQLKSRDLAKEILGNTERATLPVVEQGNKGLKAADARDAYFPVLREAGYGPTQETAGLDRSNLPDFQLAMLQARDSGMLTSRNYFPDHKADSEFFITVYYYPLYRGGIVPATVEARREQLIGYASAYTRYPAAALFDLLPQSYHGIEAVFLPAPPAGKVLESLSNEMAAFLHAPGVKKASYQALGQNFDIVAKASPSLVTSMQTSTRWWVLGIGVMLSLWMLSMLLWVRLQSNKIVALVNERTRDLADRSNALIDVNAALQESEIRYRMLANNISDVIYTSDLNGMCTYISPSVTQQCGYPVEELLGHPIYAHLEPRSAMMARAVMQKAVREIQSSEKKSDIHEFQEYEIRCKDGSTKTVESTMDVLFDEGGNPMGFLGVMRDISERKRAEKEKEQLQNAYRQAQKMEAVGTLAGGIAHDFNNLLTGVLGHADMLKAEYAGNPDAHRSVELIEMAAIRAKDLTSQLLGFARKGKFMLVPVEINTVLADLVGLMESTVDKNIVITRISCAGSPTVLGDPGQISQIFLNLAVNARDAMPKGGNLTFKTEVITLDELTSVASLGISAGEYCVISVSDTGIGIAEENIDRIFEPFFTDKEEGKGTGLGLAMVYGVVQNHKGAVHVYSEVGKGSLFKIYLPLHANPLQEQRKPLARQLVHGSGTLLLVDDQQLVRQVGEKMLTQLGYTVRLADNGVSGLEYYRQHWQEIDIVMVDMIMPKMGGLECLEAMKKINPALKAILSTGFSREDITGEINQSHILGFIQKPYRMQELSEVIAGVKQR